jgi:hypothetical protein
MTAVATWASFAEVADAMMRGNFPDWTIKERNRIFPRPESSGDLRRPTRFFEYDFRAETSDVINVGGTFESNGQVSGTLWLEGDASDAFLIDYLDRLQGISRAWREAERARPGATCLLFGGVEFSEIDYVGDSLKPSWGFRDFRMPFLYLQPLDQQGMSILGSIGYSTVQVEAPALTSLDFVGSDLGVWRRVKAVEGEPSCLGMVSEVLPGDSRLVVLSGFVRIAGGHGFAVGPLYLSQGTLGAAVSEPPATGVLRKVAEVLSATDLVILSEPG